MRFKPLYILILVVFVLATAVGQNWNLAQNAYARIATLPTTFVANDVYSSDFHTKLNGDFNEVLNAGINNVESANIADDTLTEADFADEINPRIRTQENACNDLIIDLLPTTSASLVTNFATGTAYPSGYRVRKDSTTAHTYTASKWTWTYIDINGDFQYEETAIGGAQPATPANSAIVARVSSDSTTINTVTDLRQSACSETVLDRITHGSTEPTLHDMMVNGIPISSSSKDKGGTVGWIQGTGIQYDTPDQFKVKSGSVWINDEYRRASSDITVPQTSDDPANGVSGLCSGTMGSDTEYTIYAVADEAGAKTFSVTFCDGACNGCTNSRKLGTIRTASSDTDFVSYDVNTAYSYDEEDYLSSYINMNGTTTPIYYRAIKNVSSITDNSPGHYTITWDRDFLNTGYVAVAICGTHDGAPADPTVFTFLEDQSVGSTDVRCDNNAGTDTDVEVVNLIAFGLQES